MSSSTLAPSAAPSLVRTGAFAGLVAGVANVVVFLVAKAADVSLQTELGGTTTDIVVFQPLVASFVAVLLGAVLLKLLARRSNGITIWGVIAGVVFVLETGAALSAAVDTGTGVVLTVMHVVALVVALAMLLPAARKVRG